MEKRHESMDDIFPVELIHSAGQTSRCVSKLWYSLISDPHFAELHFHHSPASSNALIFIPKGSVACFVYLDALFSDDNDASSQVKEVCLPLKKEPPSLLEVWGSCRGFVLLRRRENFLVLRNPLTGSGKEISYSRIVSRCKNKGYRNSRDFYVYGFVYDASQDDYLLVVACHDKHDQVHFNCLSLRTNSFI
ncbi:hypothetical protein HN873_014330 [Arachis hypogaea]|uniref:F-box domain-containing protein n=1 Tax=Arachis hypogaea TaxID=3818 RepID=A0A445DAM3_ARAHY|nr:hypothetical protein Ahy_A04g017322 [Arachis hypogaea]